MKMARPSVNSGRMKVITHGAQAILIFLAWALTIAIWTKGDGIDGRTAWYWALCWASIPGLVYLVAVPVWPRARRFGNVYAFASVDMLYAVLWFAAWVCLASYVAQGKAEGSDKDSKDDKNKDDNKDNNNKQARSADSKGGCDNWKYGSAAKCKLSTATTIFGVIILICQKKLMLYSLLFALTAYMSFRNVMHFRRTGTLPDAGSDPSFAAQSKAAFSSTPVHDFDEEEDGDFRSGRAGGLGGGLGGGVGGGTASSRSDRDEDYALLDQSEVDDLGHPGRSALSGGYDPTTTSGSVLPDYSTTSYGGAYGQHHYGAPTDYTPSEYGPPTDYGSMLGRPR